MGSVIAHVEKEKSPGQPWLQKEITISLVWLQKIHGQGGEVRGGEGKGCGQLSYPSWHEALSWGRGQEGKALQAECAERDSERTKVPARQSSHLKLVCQTRAPSLQFQLTATLLAPDMLNHPPVPQDASESFVFI